MEKKEREAEKLESLLEKADSHPFIKQISEEKAAGILKEREEAAVRIEKANREAAARIPEHEAILVGIENELKEHDEKRKTIFNKLTAARLSLAKVKGDLDRETRQAESILFSNYDPRIDDALEFFREKFEQLRGKRVEYDIYNSEENIFTWTKKLFSRSNYSAIRDALAYCNAARIELEKMKLMPALDTSYLEKLKAGIPDTDELTEYKIEKPLDGPGINPRDLLPSDDQLNWQMGKINEKFKKLIGRT